MAVKDVEATFERIRSLLNKLGFSDEQMPTFDKSREFLVRVDDHDGHTIVGFSFEEWTSFIRHLPPPHRLKLATTEIDFITNDQQVTEAEFRGFLARLTAGSCSVELVIDKTVLCEEWGLVRNGRLCRMFFFSEALERLLKQTLGKPADLERAIWGGADVSGLDIVVRDREIELVGPYITVASTAVAFGRVQGVSNVPAAGLKSVHQKAKETAQWNWQSRPEFLTPTHLRFEATEEDDGITKALLLHWANLSLIYMATSVDGEGSSVVATIKSTNKKCSFTLFSDDPRAVTPVLKNVLALGVSVEKVFEEPFSGDRLRLVRIIVAREFASRRQPIQLNVLTTSAQRLAKDFEWKWMAFIEGRVEEFAEDVSNFETDVAETVEAFDEQVSEMSKALSAVIVAAIGVTVAAIAAAVTKNSIDPEVIRWTLWIYSVYLLLIPGILTGWLHIARLRAIDSLFEKKRQRYGRLLPTENIDGILGTHVSAARMRFWAGFCANLVSLVAAIVACIVLSRHVESLRG